MLATRFTYLTLVAFTLVLNGWSLLYHMGAVSIGSGILQSTLIFNVIIVPLCVWGAYRVGQISEEEYRVKEREAAARGAAATSASPAPAQNHTPDGNETG